MAHFYVSCAHTQTIEHEIALYIVWHNIWTVTTFNLTLWWFQELQRSESPYSSFLLICGHHKNQKLQQKYDEKLAYVEVVDPGGSAPGAPLSQHQKWNFSEMCQKSSSDRSNPYVFGIIGKIFENAGEWCLFHARIYSVHMLKSNWVPNCAPPPFEKSWIQSQERSGSPASTWRWLVLE